MQLETTLESSLSHSSPDGAVETLRDLETVRKVDVVSWDGLRYIEFRKMLRPRYVRVWVEIVAGFLGLVLVGLALAWLHARGPAWLLIPGIPATAFAFGYGLCYLNLFLHEAGHKNLASSELWNDRLANALLSGLFGVNIKKYRETHWAHHRDLGKVSDTERSYFEPLTKRFILESLTGIRVFRGLRRLRRAAGAGAQVKAPEKIWIDRAILLYGMTIHLAILAGCVALGAWPVAAAWVLGVGLVFPLLSGLRQVLEHRDDAADPTIDYSETPHGRFNRIFGDGPFDRTFGAAGFNRHLLHHWDPTVSYTRLPDVERYLMRTIYGEPLRRNFRKILAKIPGPHVDILDVGGGTGWLIDQLKSIDPRIRFTQIVDLDEQAGDTARRAGHAYHRGRIEEFETDRRFDLILLLNLIEHVAEPVRVLQKLGACLSDSGQIYVKTPNTDCLEARLFHKTDWGVLHCPRHWVLFSRESLQTLLPSTGLKIASLRFTQGAPFWAYTVLFLLENRGLVRITRERPAVFHPLFPWLSATFAVFDFVRQPFSKTAQIFLLLEKDRDRRDEDGAQIELQIPQTRRMVD